MSSIGRGSAAFGEIREDTPPAIPLAADQQPAEVERKEKIKIDIAAMDAAMYKVHGKYAPEEEKRLAYAPRQESSGWEIDPSKLSLRQKIGEGSFGTVHRGTYEGIDVAAKIFNWDESNVSPEEAGYFKQKFLREVSIMSQLTHPNITRFIGAWTGGSEYQIQSSHLGIRGTYTLKRGTHILLMEYVSGGSLRALWINARRAGRRRLGHGVVIQLALEIGRGLAYLHSKHICHRDLKPDNLLLDGNLRVKIADFGESRLESNQTTDMSKLTGTYGYMAPEVMDGSSTTGYNHKCDVFSFGMVIWEIYNCDVPFSHLEANVNIRDMSILMCVDGLRPKIPVCCPKFLKNLITTCWDGDPNKRPEMEEIVRLIEAEPPANCTLQVTLACDTCCTFCSAFTNSGQ